MLYTDLRDAQPCPRHSIGPSDEAGACTAVKVQLHRPLEELKLLITAGDSCQSLTSAGKACTFAASLHDSYDVPEMGPCTFAADIASGGYTLEEHWLRIEGASRQAFVSIQVGRARMRSHRDALAAPVHTLMLLSDAFALR